MTINASDALAQVAAAYEGVEGRDAFSGQVAVERYRDELLARTEEQTRFLIARLPSPATVVEAACGNGRLLVALAEAGVLHRGTGFDIAASRISFASRWSADCGHEDVLAFHVADAVAVELPSEEADACVLLTGALAYFGPADPQLPAHVLTHLLRALRPGGLLLLELYPHPRERRLLEAAGGDLQTWRELPDDDPWRYYLSHMRLVGDVLVHDKTFVHRATGAVDAGRREQLKLYTADEVLALLVDTGFVDARLHAGWQDEPYGDGETMVVTARRPLR